MASTPTSWTCAARPGTKAWWISSRQAYKSEMTNAMPPLTAGPALAAVLIGSVAAKRKLVPPSKKYRKMCASLRMVSPERMGTLDADIPGGISMPKTPRSHSPTPLLTPADASPCCPENRKIPTMTASIGRAERRGRRYDFLNLLRCKYISLYFATNIIYNPYQLGVYTMPINSTSKMIQLSENGRIASSIVGYNL